MSFVDTPVGLGSLRQRIASIYDWLYLSRLNKLCQGLIRSLIPLGLLHIEELLDEEVTALAGERYARKDPSVGGRRHGSNPGTVGLAGQRVPIRVPRIRHVTEREIPLRSYEALHGDRAVNDLLLRRVLYGISCRNYAAAAEAIPGAIGLSGSTVSRAFIEQN